MPDYSEYPRISIVTPSYNQGEFLEQTIRSVLWQDYPNLEYIIIDGGSTDNSVEIIKKYEQHLTYWVSEPDSGQSHAINKGFARCTGEIMAWVNSDDLYLPQTLWKVVTLFKQKPKAGLVTGAWIGYNSQSRDFMPTRACGLGIYPTTGVMLTRHGYIGQPSTFWRKYVWATVGPLKEHLHYAMDHEFFLNCGIKNLNFVLTAEYLSVIQEHPNQKTKQGDRYLNEFRKVIQPCINSPRWKKKLARLELTVAKWLLSLMHHRNIHPRLGLAPKVDEISLRQWLSTLQQQTHELIPTKEIERG